MQTTDFFHNREIIIWDLHADHTPTNENDFLDKITFLNEHPEWIKNHFDAAKDSFKLLETTRYCNCQCHETARKIHDSLIEKFSQLSLILNYKIPLNNLSVATAQQMNFNKSLDFDSIRPPRNQKKNFNQNLRLERFPPLLLNNNHNNLPNRTQTIMLT